MVAATILRMALRPHCTARAELAGPSLVLSISPVPAVTVRHSIYLGAASYDKGPLVGCEDVWQTWERPSRTAASNFVRSHAPSTKVRCTCQGSVPGVLSPSAAVMSIV